MGINLSATGNTVLKTEAAGFKVEKLFSVLLEVMRKLLPDWKVDIMPI